MKPDYKPILADLLARRDKLNSAIAAIQEFAGESASVKPKPSEFKRMTIAEAAIQFIQNSGQPQETGDIAAALKAGGLGSNAKNLYRTLYNSLVTRMKTQKDIVKVGSKWGVPS